MRAVLPSLTTRLEPDRVDVGRIDVEDVAVASGADQVRARQVAAQPGDVRLQRGRRGRGRILAPESVDEPVARPPRDPG